MDAAKQDKAFDEKKKEALFYFPFPSVVSKEKSSSGLRYQKFALLPYGEAKRLMNQMSMSLEQYTNVLLYGFDNCGDPSEMETVPGIPNTRHFITMPIIEVCDDGTNIFSSPKVPRGEVRFEQDDCRIEPFERDGILHGHWSYCPVVVSDTKRLKELVCKTFGDRGSFGNRNTAQCFGHNTYAGEKGAAYVTPTIRMSPDAVTLSQFWRSSTDPTYVPTVMKMLNVLSSDAVNFQRCVDPVYYGFIKSCFNDLYSDPTKVPSSNKRARGQMSDHRGECALTIMTCGNNQVCGFSNTQHVDRGDIWSSSLQQLGKDKLNVLRDIYDSADDTTDDMQRGLRHLTNLSRASVDSSFSSYTTCGYSLSFTADNVSLCFFWSYRFKSF